MGTEPVVVLRSSLVHPTQDAESGMSRYSNHPSGYRHYGKRNTRCQDQRGAVWLRHAPSAEVCDFGVQGVQIAWGHADRGAGTGGLRQVEGSCGWETLMSDGGSRRRDRACASQIPYDVSGYQAHVSKNGRTHSSCLGFLKGR